MTSWPSWALRQFRASRGLVLVLLAVVTLTTAILAGSLGNARLLAARSAHAALAAPTHGDAGLRIRTRLGTDPVAQDAAARGSITATFGDVPVTVSTSLSSEPVTIDGKRVVLYSGDDYSPGPLEVVTGTWPSGPGEAALQVDAAARLGLEADTTVAVAGRELRITALWRAADPAAPLWLGDQLVLTGHDASASGPLVVDRSVMEDTSAPFVSWVVLPDVNATSPAQLGALAERATAAATAVKVADTTGRGLVITGDLATTAAQAQRDSASGDAFGFIPVSALVLIGLVGLTQVSGLLNAARERQTSLLFARGASLRQVLGTSLAEAAVVSVGGSAVGTALAALLLGFVVGDASQTGAVLLGGLAGAGLALASVGAMAVRAALAAARGHQPRPDRVRNVAGLAAVVLVAILAVVAAWQLRRTSTFIRIDDEGAAHLDVVAALAPSLLLALAAVAALALLTPLTRLLEAVMHRSRSTGIWLASAQVARGLRLHAVAVTLTVLATGTATFAAFFSGTAAGIADTATAVAQAAPIRVSLSPSATGSAEVPDLSVVAGVRGTTPVWSGEAGIGDQQMPLVLAPIADLAGIVTLPDGLTLPAPSTLAPPAGSDPTAERVPVALTPAAAEAASLSVGDLLEVRAFATRFPARVATITAVVPSVDGPLGLLADSTTVARVLGPDSTGLGAPTQLWAGFEGDPVGAKADIASLDGVASVSVSTGANPAGPAAVAANALWVTAGCAMVLAVVGLAAASATAAATRRPEVAVLRALGMTPRGQARSRAWESGGVLGLAAASGLVGGWVVSLLTAHPVATTAAQVWPGLPASLRLDALPWLALLSAGTLAAAAVVTHQARTVGMQAKDETYREEVR